MRPGEGEEETGCTQTGPAELAVPYETGSQRLQRERNPLALPSSRPETVVGRTRMRGRGTTSSACGRRVGPGGPEPNNSSGGIGGKPLPGLQGPCSSWVGSCGLLSWELWRWGPSEMEELQALPLGVLEVGCAPERRPAISPGGAGDRVPLLRLLPPVGRMQRFSSSGNHWRRSSLPGRLPLC